MICDESIVKINRMLWKLKKYRSIVNAIAAKKISIFYFIFFLAQQVDQGIFESNAFNRQFNMYAKNFCYLNLCKLFELEVHINLLVSNKFKENENRQLIYQFSFQDFDLNRHRTLIWSIELYSIP